MSHFELELESFEMIARGGVRKVIWMIEQRDEWVGVGHVEGTRVESEDAGRGTVWQQRAFVTVTPGARLMRVESRPAERTARDPLDYLQSAKQGSSRDVRRSFFVVNARGKLERLRHPPQLK